jgi:hypothetical protein
MAGLWALCCGPAHALHHLYFGSDRPPACMLALTAHTDTDQGRYSSTRTPGSRTTIDLVRSVRSARARGDETTCESVTVTAVNCDVHPPHRQGPIDGPEGATTISGSDDRHAEGAARRLCWSIVFVPPAALHLARSHARSHSRQSESRTRARYVCNLLADRQF